MSRGSLTTRKGLAVKWAILFGLLWAQVALAEHQHEHAVDDDISHVCGICLKLDPGDAVPAGAAPTCTVFLPVLPASPVSVAAETPEPFPHYSARASP